MTIKINNESLRIRPSAVDNFYGCAYQWGKKHLEGLQGRAKSRSAIGTAIHKGIEVSWQEAQKVQRAEHNLTMMQDAAMESFREELNNDMAFGNDETQQTCETEIVKGIEAWKEDISQFLAIPSGVEQFFQVDLQHPLVHEVGGTIDYIAPMRDGAKHGFVLDDVKTSKRKSNGSSYQTQQSIYKYLADANDHPILMNRIQQVVLKKAPEAQIIQLDTNVSQAKNLVNGMLDTLELVAKDVVPIEQILRGNPTYVFCSKQYCECYYDCPFVAGKVEAANKQDLIPAVQL